MNRLEKRIGLGLCNYEFHNGTKYKRQLMNYGRRMEASGNVITKYEIESVHTRLDIVGRVSRLERRTIKYMLASLNMTSAAKKVLQDILDRPDSPGAFDEEDSYEDRSTPPPHVPIIKQVFHPIAQKHRILKIMGTAPN